MNELWDNLERIGLSQYYDSFSEEGFDTWDTVLYITESDLDALNVRLGHRRRLQKEIAQARNISFDSLIPQVGLIGVPEHPSNADKGKQSNIAPNDNRGSELGPAPKRKYRRHPKPDENAPERPPSAYVIFSNVIREEVKDRKLSFTEIAKTVGERWQRLSPTEKKRFESDAASAKEDYNAELARYKRTNDFKKYQQYLNEFKAKNSTGTGDIKRPKVERNLRTESSGSAGSVGNSPYVANGLVEPVTHGTRIPDASNSFTRSPTKSLHGSPALASSKLTPVASIEASSPSSTATTPVTAVGHRFTPGSQNIANQSTRLQSLPRIVPLHSPADTILSPANLPPIATNPSRAPYMMRRTANPHHASLIRHDTSKSSISSNFSNTSAVSSAFTPITPLDDNRALPTSPSQTHATNYAHPSRPQPLPSYNQQGIREHGISPHSSDSLETTTYRLTRCDSSGADALIHDHPIMNSPDRTNMPKDINQSFSNMRPPSGHTEAVKGEIDPLSVLALAGHLVDSEMGRNLRSPP